MEGIMVSSSSSETPHERTLFGSSSFKSNNGDQCDQLFGSGSFKHDRSNNGDQKEDEAQQWRFSKLSRTDSMASNNSVYSNGNEGQMLSFSSGNANGGSLHSYNYNPSNHHHYFRNEGGSMTMTGNMQERVRGPFTPSQWMELEHQALIYKYFASNSPIPPSLLLPLARTLNPFSPPSYFGGWGAQMGYGLSLTSGAGDSEPGRCRRTDGKKWRCSRDAVPDQKYCERHINRGRHRSRKHVEPPAKPATKPATSAPPADSAPAPAQRHHHKSTTDLWSQERESLSLLTPMLPFSSSKNQSSNGNGNSNSNSNSNSGTNMFEPSYQRYQSWPELQDERTQLSISTPSMGGPLGEVLTKNGNSDLTNKDLSSKGGLNLLTGLGWDLDPDPQPGSSPTGVLQKTGFGSLTSSAGSSPRLESYKAHDDLGSILVNHLSNLSSV